MARVRFQEVSVAGLRSRCCVESLQEISQTFTCVHSFIIFVFQNFQHYSVSHWFSFISTFHVTKQKLDFYHQSQVGSIMTVGLHSVPVKVGSRFPYLANQSFHAWLPIFWERINRITDVIDSSFNCKYLCKLKSYYWYYRARQTIQIQGIPNWTASASVKMLKTCKRTTLSETWNVARHQPEFLKRALLS